MIRQLVLLVVFAVLAGAFAKTIVPRDLESRTLLQSPQAIGCKCNDTICSCCAEVDVPVFHQSVCARLLWLQQRNSISVRVDWNGGVLFERLYNTSHPASCAHVPVLGDVCFAMDNYTITSYGACGVFELDFVLFFSTYTFPFGDFQFGDVRKLTCPTTSQARVKKLADQEFEQKPLRRVNKVQM